MVDLTKKFGVDPELERQGVWCDFGDGMRVKIARWGNPDFQRLLVALQKPYRFQLDTGTLPPDVDRQIMNELIAKTIIRDWEHVELDGTVLECSLAERLRVLTDERIHDFRSQVIRYSQEAEAFRRHELEEEAGNSARSSAGS